MKILEDCINSAIIVDDKEDEIVGLRNMLTDNGISVEFHEYKGDFHVAGEGHLKNRNLIFMDLMLNDNCTQDRENISIVISVLAKLTNGPHFGSYGLIVWTKHDEFIKDLKDSLSKVSLAKENNEVEEEADSDDEEEITTDIHLDNPPLFVIGLSKSKYNKGDGIYDYTSLQDDLEQQLLENKSAYFFVNWNATVEKAKNKIVRNFYDLGSDYDKREVRLNYLFCSLAKNHTGINAADDYPYLTADAYKAFDELLYSELYAQQAGVNIPLFETQQNCPFENVEEKQNIAAVINAMMFIDSYGLSSEEVVPGNIYKVNVSESPLITEGKACEKLIKYEREKLNKIKEKNEKIKQFNKKNPELKEEFEIFEPECWNVAIELTPPCDYSQNKRKMARLVGGYIFDIPLGSFADKQGSSRFSDSHCLPERNSDKEYTIGPVFLNGKVRYVIFDFTYLVTESIEKLRDKNCYEICYRAKPKLFSHILQRFSSHAARLGLANIEF